MKTNIVTLLLLLFTCSFLNAQVKVAKIDRSLWPENLNSVENFDYASKMQILVYAKCFLEIQNLNNVEEIKAKYNIKSANVNSFSTWKKDQIQLILQNLHSIKSQTVLDKTIAINKNCTWQDVVKATEKLDKSIPANLKLWYANASDFSRQYANELARLAFLFPKTSSEILTLAPNEITGSNYADKEFLLTFDDGPTKENGNTDKLTATLKSLNLNGMFFVLGEQLQNRINATSTEKLNKLYSNNKLESHGKIHKSHQYLETWQESIDYTFGKIKTITDSKNSRSYFRPPYGQRTEKVANYLNSINASVLLWNIDSQDWNSKINASEVSDRVITLMLLWRKGVVLFHDIHPKANEALPVMVKSLNGSGILFMDANKF
ncbi:polysaccharide deacetylase family protein [Flavobacterium antarcticum]|uniref:polysaccharide deacetylase family protein n=1 Tax=Flavobacterium antarcticum TaxID=271155 RepID=UPI0003B660F3|nr:polysaccharide deacetylase family protein [Flavobacterium antarcticum]